VTATSWNQSKREDAGLTQQQFADRLEVSPQYLRRVESGGANLSVKSLLRFASGLGVEVADLFEAPRRVGKRNPGRPPKKRAGTD
jgi:transcriptional regulator with XRE-family HTH domain